MNNLPKVFVTGSTGFIGKSLCDELLKRKFDLVAIPRDMFYRGSNAELSNFFHEKKASDSSILIHLAAAGVTSQVDLKESLYVNVVCTDKLLKAAANTGFGSAIVTGSCFEYGKSGADFLHLPVNAPLQPVGHHAVSKVESFHNLSSGNHNFKFGLTYARLFQVYGLGENENRLFPSLIKAARNGADFQMSDGAQVRDFTHVSFVILALIYEINLIDDFKIINIASGYGASVKEFAEHYWKLTGATGKLKLGELPRKKSDLASIVGEPTVDEKRKRIPPYNLHSLI